MKYSSEQLAKAQTLANKLRNPDVIKPFIMYKKNDQGLALFRVQATNNLQDIIIRKANGLPLTKPLQGWIDTWIYDPGTVGDMMRAFVEALNKG